MNILFEVIQIIENFNIKLYLSFDTCMLKCNTKKECVKNKIKIREPLRFCLSSIRFKHTNHLKFRLAQKKNKYSPFQFIPLFNTKYKIVFIKLNENKKSE